MIQNDCMATYTVEGSFARNLFERQKEGEEESQFQVKVLLNEAVQLLDLSDFIVQSIMQETDQATSKLNFKASKTVMMT